MDQTTTTAIGCYSPNNPPHQPPRPHYHQQIHNALHQQTYWLYLLSRGPSYSAIFPSSRLFVLMCDVRHLNFWTPLSLPSFQHTSVHGIAAVLCITIRSGAQDNQRHKRQRQTGKRQVARRTALPSPSSLPIPFSPSPLPSIPLYPNRSASLSRAYPSLGSVFVFINIQVERYCTV